MKKIYFLSIFCLITFSCFSQCTGAYFLYTQKDVNEFPAKVKWCKEINQLTIYAEGDSDITNLDSLYFIEKIKTFYIRNNPALKSIDGLKNLRYVEGLQIRLYDPLWTFSSLDTVGYMAIDFKTPGLNLACFSNVKVIGSISTFGDCHFSGLNKYKSFSPLGVGFGIHSNTIPNKIADLLPVNISDLYASLTLSDCKNLDTKGLEGIPIRKLGLENIYRGDVDFTALNHVTKLTYVDIRLYKNKPAYLDILPNLDTIETLLLLSNYVDINVFNFSKNVKKVSGWIAIENNENYKDLTWLDKLPLPGGDALNFRFTPEGKKCKIIIKENKNLEICNVDMLCKALVRYPDSVYIEGNGKKCNKMEILEFCKKTSSIDDRETTISIFPNPTSSTVWIKGLEKTSNYIIRDIMGKELSVGRTFDTVDIHYLPSGIYILEIQDEGIATITKIKFVKY